MSIDINKLNRQIHNKIKELINSPFILDLVTAYCTNNKIRISTYHKDKVPYSHMFFIPNYCVSHEDKIISVIAKEIILAIPDKRLDLEANNFIVNVYLEYDLLIISIIFDDIFDHLGD